MRKPREKATPIIAMPLPLVEGVETSVTIAVDKETFPAGEINLYLMHRHGLEQQTMNLTASLLGKTTWKA